MATAMPAIEWEEEEQCSSDSGEIAVWEDQPRPSSRLMESRRQELAVEVEEAKRILEVPGQEAFYSREALDRAVAFLEMHMEWMWRSYGFRAPIPTIGVGPDASVDLFWEQAPWKLLVNIPATADALATFYTDDHGRQKTKGSFDPSELSYSLAACLIR